MAGINYCLVLEVRPKVSGINGASSAVYATLWTVTWLHTFHLTSHKKFALPVLAEASGAPVAGNQTAAPVGGMQTGSQAKPTATASAAALQCPASPNSCPGCFSPATTGDAGVAGAADFAVQQLNAEKGWNATLVSIDQATSQVVSGANYCIAMTLQQPGSAPFPVLVTVWDIPWLSKYQLTAVYV